MRFLRGKELLFPVYIAPFTPGGMKMSGEVFCAPVRDWGRLIYRVRVMVVRTRVSKRID